MLRPADTTRFHGKVRTGSPVLGILLRRHTHRLRRSCLHQWSERWQLLFADVGIAMPGAFIMPLSSREVTDPILPPRSNQNQHKTRRKPDEVLT